METGKDIYNFYCYQCHGHGGNGRTVAGRYLHPIPRDFTLAGPDVLTRERMVEAVVHGRPGTAMVSFARVLDPGQIGEVVDFIRENFMTSQPLQAHYHTPENGWPNHVRYRDAFPFATGEISMEIPWEDLDEKQRAGRRLYISVCISCHETGAGSSTPRFDLSAASYPRLHYSHRMDSVDSTSGASVHRDHEVPPRLQNLAPEVLAGRELYLKNCAFCHAEDGTGRNWIGSFLEPHPRDFTVPGLVSALGEKVLADRIASGIPGTSMPAWRDVFSREEIASIVAYLIAEFGSGEQAMRPSVQTSDEPGLGLHSLQWRRME